MHMRTRRKFWDGVPHAVLARLHMERGPGAASCIRDRRGGQASANTDTRTRTRTRTVAIATATKALDLEVLEKATGGRLILQAF